MAEIRDSAAPNPSVHNAIAPSSAAANPAAPNSVVIEGLVKRFGSFVAVDHIDLEVRKGEIFGFLGPNGAGKSTTIRMLCGLLKPTSGRALVAGYDVSREPEEVRQRIGYMSQKFSLYNDLKVIENIRLFAGLYSVPASKLQARIEWALAMANLKGQENLITGTLPGGWKQRLALGCAVLHRPSILFLDEPTSGVDPITRRQFWELIHQMAEEGVTVFVTTHYMEEAEYCNRLALIFRGKIVALGTPSELKRDAMKGELLLVECAPLGEAVEALQAAPGVTDAAVFGNALHLVVANAASVIPQLKDFLAARGVAVNRIEKIRPSLEDAFVSLTTNRDAAPERRPEGRRPEERRP
jgi:ABC-2 type transport system ATP-binding protein